MAGKRKAMAVVSLARAAGATVACVLSPDIQQMEDSGVGFTQRKSAVHSPASWTWLPKATGTGSHAALPANVPTARAPREWEPQGSSPPCALQVTSAWNPPLVPSCFSHTPCRANKRTEQG